MSRRKFGWVILGCMTALAIVLTSCGPAEVAEEEEEEEEEIVGEDWWDAMGEPEYGGTLTVRVNSLRNSFDNWFAMTNEHSWMEHLIMNDPTLDRDIYAFKIYSTPNPDYWTGWLLESWEWTDAQTLVGHVRQGVHFHDKEPVNGRELTADDIVYHYDYMLGKGHGYTEPSPFFFVIASIESVTAIDKYTVEIKFSSPSMLNNFWTITDTSALNKIEPHETIEAGANLWENAAGTGAFMLEDFQVDSSMTLAKNPNYWGYDMRHPENKLPYLDKVVEVVIPDKATALAALRTGQIDTVMGEDSDLTWEDADLLEQNDPDIVTASRPFNGYDIGMRCDTEPFTNKDVRTAMQMAINLQEIAETYYGGMTSPNPPGPITPANKDWVVQYEDWPDDLKAEYAYDPEGAMALLDDAGYTPDPATGIRIKTNVIAGSHQDLDLLQIVKAYLLDIGVDLDIRVMEPTAMTAFLDAMQHDQMFYTIFSGMTAPINVALSFTGTQGGNQETCHGDTDYDAYFVQFVNAPDVDSAQAISKEADQYFLKQHWYIQLPQRVIFDAAQPYVKGWASEYLCMWREAYYWSWFWIDHDMKADMGF